MTVMRVRAIVVKQPWAELIIAGTKSVENRSWLTHHRGPLAIVAGRDTSTLEALGLDVHRFALGALIGVVDLVDVVENHESPWARDEHYHWTLANPRRLAEPVRVRGQQGMFTVELDS